MSEDIKTEIAKPKNKKGKREPTSLHVDPALWQEVRVMAVLKNVSVTEYFEDALRRKIDVDNLEAGRQGYKIGQGGTYIPPPPVSGPTNSQSPRSQQIREREWKQYSPYFNMFESDTAEAEPGGKSIEVSINLPGIEFPINKNELVNFAVYLDYVFDYTNVAVEGFYYPLFRDLPDKVYTNKEKLAEDLQIMLDTSKRGFFGKRKKVVGVNLLTTREEIERNGIEASKRQIGEYFREIDKFHKGIAQEKLEKLKRYQEKQIQDIKSSEEFLERDRKEWRQKQRKERELERKEYEFDKTS